MIQKLLPAREVRVEIEVKKSRFIASAAPVFSVEAARDFIQRIKDEFSDASHNVPAFLVGHGASVIAHSSDDGEPGGTAGRPALAVLQGSGLGDVVVVVTRYFGGIRLGTGGLVRAYGDAVRALLKAMPLAEKTTTQVVHMAVSYPLLERVRLLIAANRGEVLEETFAADIAITARFPLDAVAEFGPDLLELSNGRHALSVLKTDEETIVPL